MLDVTDLLLTEQGFQYTIVESSRRRNLSKHGDQLCCITWSHDAVTNETFQQCSSGEGDCRQIGRGVYSLEVFTSQHTNRPSSTLAGKRHEVHFWIRLRKSSDLVSTSQEFVILSCSHSKNPSISVPECWLLETGEYSVVISEKLTHVSAWALGNGWNSIGISLVLWYSLVVNTMDELSLPTTPETAKSKAVARLRSIKYLVPAI